MAEFNEIGKAELTVLDGRAAKRGAAEAASGAAAEAGREGPRDEVGTGPDAAAQAGADGGHNNPRHKGEQDGGRRRSFRTALLVVVAALAAGVFVWGCFAPALGTLRHGFPTYYVAARLMWEGRWTPKIYDNAWYSAEVMARTPNGIGEVYAPNPPTAALLALPLAWLDIITARQVWLWLNLALFAGALRLLMAGLPGEALGARVALAAGALLAAPVHENFRLGQVYVLLLFGFAVTLWQLRRGRALRAGVPLGMAAALKLSGSPLWLILALRGQWRTLGLAVLAGLGVGGVSLVFVGWAGWQRFAQSLVEHMGEHGWAAATAFQTVPSFFQHLTRPDAVWNPRPLLELPAWVGRAATLAVGGAGLALVWRRARTASLELVFAVALTLGVVLLPFAEEYHYALLVLPYAAAVRHLAGERGRVTPLRAAWLAAAAVLVAVPFNYKHPWFFDGWHALLAYPRMYGGWLLWAWLMRAMADEAPAA